MCSVCDARYVSFRDYLRSDDMDGLAEDEILVISVALLLSQEQLPSGTM